MDVQKYLEERIAELRLDWKQNYELAVSKDTKPNSRNSYESLAIQAYAKYRELQIMLEKFIAENYVPPGN